MSLKHPLVQEKHLKACVWTEGGYLMYCKRLGAVSRYAS